MIINRRNQGVGLEEIASAIRSGQRVVFALKLDYSAVLALEECLSRLTDLSVSLVNRRGRYVVETEPYELLDNLTQDTEDDLSGTWFPIVPSELELAVALA